MKSLNINISEITDNEIKAKISGLMSSISLNPLGRESYINLGIVLSRIKRFDEAITCFSMATELHEDYLTLYNTGSLYYKKNEYKNAILCLEKSKKLNNSFSMASLVTGLCYSRLNNIKAAETNFINVLMNDPDNRIALTALSILFYNQGKVKESVRLISRITGVHKQADKLKKIRTEMLCNSAGKIESPAVIKEVKKDLESFKLYDDYIVSVPVELYTDKYGTINDKIKYLETTPLKTKENLISLSLCYLFRGDSDSALDYLFQAKKTS